MSVTDEKYSELHREATRLSSREGRKRFEYSTVFPEHSGFPDKTHKAYMDRIMNEKGVDGWEFAGSGENRFYYFLVFKRELDDGLQETA